MSLFLSRLHDSLRSARLTRRGVVRASKYVPTLLYKEYPRMERIELPSPAHIPHTLDTALAQRRSADHAEAGIPLTLQDMGTLFGHALRQHTHDERRNYPSGGALYPIETYLIATRTDGFAPSVFHYHPVAHALERLWDLPDTFDMKLVASKPDERDPSALIVFTSVWERSAQKYGDLSYLHAILEAGHMSQNILLTGTALSLETRPYAGFSDRLVNELLDLDDRAEQPVHTITLSKPASGRNRSPDQDQQHA